MLKHLAIAAASAALLLGISAGGYLFAAINLNSSRSNNYKLENGTTVQYSYTFNITVDPAIKALTVAERKNFLAQACAQAAQDIAPTSTR